jgi:hypothetical protein
MFTTQKIKYFYSKGGASEIQKSAATLIYNVSLDLPPHVDEKRMRKKHLAIQSTC